MVETWNEATRNEALTVNDASIQVAQLNEKRQAIYFRNDSTAAQIITLGFGLLPAALNAGVVLSVGQYIADSNSEGYSCYKGSVQAIATGAGATLSVFER